MDAVKLTEVDIPGASLSGRAPEDLKVPELKRWLACRNARTGGKNQNLSGGERYFLERSVWKME